MSIRQAIIEEIEALSLPSKQLEYERNVPIANVPAELICVFCDDLYHPKSNEFISQFSEEELKELAHLYGVLVEASNLEVSTVSELLKQPEWRKVVSVAKELSSYFERNA